MSDLQKQPEPIESTTDSSLKPQIYPVQDNSHDFSKDSALKEPLSNKSSSSNKYEVAILLLIMFGVVFGFAYYAGSNLLPAKGESSLLSETYYFPLKLAYSFCVAVLSYVIIAFYGSIKMRYFFGLLTGVLILELNMMQAIMTSTLSGWLQLTMHFEHRLEYALIFAGVVTYFRIMFVASASFREHLRTEKTGLRKFVRVVVTLFILVTPLGLSMYADSHYEIAKKDVFAIRLPNSQIYSVNPLPVESPDITQKQWSYRIEYPKLVFDELYKEADDLYVYKVDPAPSLADLCKSAEYRVTATGVEYGLSIEEKNSSNPPREESRYQEKTICFRIGGIKYLLVRNNAYGRKSYEQYSDDIVISEFFNNSTYQHY